MTGTLRAANPQAVVRFACVLILVTAAASGLFVATAGAGPLHRASRQVSFYGDLGNPVNSSYTKNPLLARPSRIFLFEDGSWVLERLHWQGWGSGVARARGISSASNCTPSCAAGKRTNVPAQFTLSSPGRVLGHLVYRCFQLTVPSHPQSDEHKCLGRVGKLILYQAVSTSKPPPASTSGVAFSPNPAGITCILKDNGTAKGAWVFCFLGTQWPPVTHAKLGLAGRIDEKSTIPEPMGLGGRALQYGKSITVGRFRCASKTIGLSCVVVETGKGLVIRPSGIAQEGP